MKKILFYVHSLNKGGAERVLLTLGEELRKDYNVVVVTDCVDEREYNLPEGITRIVLNDELQIKKEYSEPVFDEKGNYEIENGFIKTRTTTANLYDTQMQRNVITISGNDLDNQYKIPYAVQYNESSYDFLCRTAAKYGEFLYPQIRNYPTKAVVSFC